MENGIAGAKRAVPLGPLAEDPIDPETWTCPKALAAQITIKTEALQ
jgi:hypothetical protein